MQPACIRQTDLPHTTRLFADFAYRFDRVARFYRHHPHDVSSFRAAAAEMRYPAERRRAMAKALAEQNGPSEALERFARPETLAVVTGQQVGLFSGPAYTIYKALTAARLAAELTAAGLPAVPVFWLASEDHDFAEVNHAWTFDSAHQPFALRVAGPEDGQPVGEVALNLVPHEPLRESLARFPHAEEVAAMVAEAYPAGVTMAAGFRALLTKLLARFGLLYLDPLDAAVRHAGAPLMRQSLEAAGPLKARLLERNRELEAAGYHTQVHLDEKTSLFFLLEGGRRVALRRKNGEYAALADRAEQISPNALLRPVLQDYLLPTVAYVGGPAELAYMAQAQVLYDALLERMPVVTARSGFTLLDARAQKLMERYRLSVTDVFEGEEPLREKIASVLMPASLHVTLEETRAEVTERVDRLHTHLEKFDHTLAETLAKSRSKILYQLDKIGRKAAREALRRNARAIEDARFLSGLLYPHKHLQERFYSILPFLAKHGLNLVDRLYESVELGCPDHRLLVC